MSKADALKQLVTKWPLDSASQKRCWAWPGRRNKDRYGVITVRTPTYTRRYLVHRLVFEQKFGPIPRDKRVLHKCDNPPCWNPAHLFLGTQAENMRDMVRKGRNRSRR